MSRQLSSGAGDFTETAVAALTAEAEPSFTLPESFRTCACEESAARAVEPAPRISEVSATEAEAATESGEESPAISFSSALKESDGAGPAPSVKEESPAMSAAAESAGSSSPKEKTADAAKATNKRANVIISVGYHALTKMTRLLCPPKRKLLDSPCSSW